MNPELFIDFILGLSSIGLAILSLTVRQVFTGIVLYISMGLLVTIIWARLQAWDVAIAEAAIGAGLTGALLLVAWRHLNRAKEQKFSRNSIAPDTSSNSEGA